MNKLIDRIDPRTTVLNFPAFPNAIPMVLLWGFPNLFLLGMVAYSHNVQNDMVLASKHCYPAHAT